MSKTTKPCECGNWADPDGTGTGCTATTKRLFAQGHDARLASWLTTQQAAGRLVRRDHPQADGLPVTPAEAAATIGLRYDIAARAAKLATRKTRKPAADQQPEPEPVAVKIGRWEYLATIDPDGTARYQAKNGEAKTAPAGSYKTLVTIGGDAR